MVQVSVLMRQRIPFQLSALKAAHHGIGFRRLVASLKKRSRNRWGSVVLFRLSRQVVDFQFRSWKSWKLRSSWVQLRLVGWFWAFSENWTPLAYGLLLFRHHRTCDQLIDSRFCLVKAAAENKVILGPDVFPAVLGLELKRILKLDVSPLAYGK